MNSELTGPIFHITFFRAAIQQVGVRRAMEKLMETLVNMPANTKAKRQLWDDFRAALDSM
jgi:hypothetical protein